MKLHLENIRNIILGFIIIISSNCFTMTMASVTVTEQGVRPVTPGDVAMIFYSKVTNEGPGSYRVRLDMVKCCLVLSENLTDCNAMQLHSGLGVILHPKISHNLSMYFVNHDLLGREGECTLNLLSWKADNNSENKTEKPEKPESKSELKIKFNEPFQPANYFRKLLVRMGGSADGYSFCETADQSSNCGQGNCIMRYSGFRSIFNRTTNLCEITPLCTKVESKVMISPNTGKCRSIFSKKRIHGSMLPEMKASEIGMGLELELEKATEKRINDLAASNRNKKRNADEEKSNHAHLLAPLAPKVSCEHGTPDGIGCKCDEGWSSKSLEETGGGSKSSYQMCDVLTPEGELMQKSNTKRNSQIMLSILLILLLGFVIFLVIGFFFLWKRKQKFFYQKLPKAIHDEHSDDIISVITGRREEVLPPAKLTDQQPQIQTNQNPKPPIIITDAGNNLAASQGLNQSVSTLATTLNDLESPTLSATSLKSGYWYKRPFSASSIDAENKQELNIQKPSLHKWVKKGPTSPESPTKLTLADKIWNTQFSQENYLTIASKQFPWESSTSSTNINMDKILSLSIKEKPNRTQSETMLQPTRKVDLPTTHHSIDLSTLSWPIVTKTSSEDSRLKLHPTDKTPRSQIDMAFSHETELDLNDQQKREEWAKFEKAFHNNEISRRRSLCTIEELTDNAQLFPSVTHIANKVQSMPTMSIGPFSSETGGAVSIYSTDELHRSPIWTPPIPISNQTSATTTSFVPGIVNKKRSKNSLTTVDGNEWIEMNDAFSMLSRFEDIGIKQTTVTSPETSKTSIWSNVASDNACEPNVASVCCSRTTSVEEFANFSEDLPTIDELSEELSTNEENTISNSPSNLNALKISNSLTQKKSLEKKHLTAAQRIEQAAKLKGYVTSEKSSDSGFLMESDILPSEVFRHLKSGSPVSSTELFKTNAVVLQAAQEYSDSMQTGTKFWAKNIASKRQSDEHNVYNELDPYVITSKLKQSLKASKSKSLDSIITSSFAHLKSEENK